MWGRVRDRLEGERTAERNRRRVAVRAVLRARPEYMRRLALHESGHVCAFHLCGVSTARAWFEPLDGGRLDGWTQPSTAGGLPAWPFLAGVAAEWCAGYGGAVPHVRRNAADLLLATQRLAPGETVWSALATAKDRLWPHTATVERIAAALLAEGELDAADLRPLLADVR